MWVSDVRNICLWSAVIASLPLLAGCGSISDINLKDAEWFSGRRFFDARSVSIDRPALTPDRAVAADQLITADGVCPGLTPNDAQALAGSDQPAPIPSGRVGLGQPECEVARGIGSPDSVNIANEGGSRVTVLTYVRGPRPGIYRFVDGRLAGIERGAEPPLEPRVKGRKRSG